MKKLIRGLMIFVLALGFVPWASGLGTAGSAVYAAESISDMSTVIEDEKLCQVLQILANYQEKTGDNFYDLVPAPDSTDITTLPEAQAYNKPVSQIVLESYGGMVDLAPYKDMSNLEGLNYAKGVTEVRLPDSDGFNTIKGKSFYEMIDLKTVIMPKSVTVIEASAFEKCYELERINLYGEPENDERRIHLENVVNIGNSAFASCKGFEFVNFIIITNNSNDQLYIGSNAFTSCTSLQAVSIPKAELGTGIFSGCHSLANVVFDDSHTIIPNNTFANVIPAEGAVFHLPLNLSEIGFYAFEGSIIQKMNISECVGLTEIGDYAFQGTVLFDSDEADNPDAWKCDFSKCTKLTTIRQHAFANAVFAYGKVTLPDSVSKMGISVFFATSGLKSVNIPKSMEAIPDGTFMASYDLAEVLVPADAAFTSVGAHAFDLCGNLSDINFLAVNGKVTEIGEYAFARCIPTREDYAAGLEAGSVNGLKNITIPKTVTKIGASAFENDFMVESADFGTGVTEIPDRLLICEKATSPSFTNVELTDVISKEKKTYPFAGSDTAYANLRRRYSGFNEIYTLSALKTLTLSDKLSYIGNYAFFGHSSLENVTYNGDKVTEDGMHFASSLTTIGDYAFAYCAKKKGSGEELVSSGITDVILPDSVESIGSHAFYFDFNLETVTLPSGLSVIPDYCFAECGYNNKYDGEDHYCGLKLISDLSRMETIGDYAFYRCYNFYEVKTASGTRNITFGRSLTRLGRYSFSETGIKEANTLSMSSIEKIENNTFRNCPELTVVYCPDSLVSIEDDAFYNCPKLNEINFPVYATLSSKMIEYDDQSSLTLTPTLGMYRNKIYKVPVGLTISLPAEAFAGSNTEKISQLDPVTHKAVELSQAETKYFDVSHEKNTYKITGGATAVEGTAVRISATIPFTNSLSRTMSIDYPVDVLPISADKVELKEEKFKLSSGTVGPVVDSSGTSPTLYLPKSRAGRVLTLAAVGSADGAGTITDPAKWKVVSGTALTLKEDTVTKTIGEKECLTTADFTINDVGTCTVMAMFDDGSATPPSKTLTVAVINEISSLSYSMKSIGENHMNPGSFNMPVGQSDTVNAVPQYSDESDKRDGILYSSSDSEVATVDANGKITAIKGGSAKITISTTTNSTSRSFTVNVINKGEVVEPSFIEIVGPKTANNQGEVFVGDTAVYSAKCLPSYANSGVLWTLSATTNLGLKVSNDMAYITGIKEGGTATLTARAANGNSSASLKIVALEKTSSLEFRETPPVIEKGKVYSLKLSSDSNQKDGIVRVPSASIQDVTFTSNKNSVLQLGTSSSSCKETSLTLSGKTGTLYYTGLAAGSALITAETESGATATLRVLVIEKPITKVTCTYTDVILLKGASSKMRTEVTPSSTDEHLTYESSDTKVATVDVYGNITAVGTGTATVTAKSTINNAKASCTVTVLKKGQTIVKGNCTYKVNKDSTLSLYKVNSSVSKLTVPATVKLSWNSYKVTKISASVAKGKTSIKKVTIGSNVTSIGKNAFAGCSSLKTITIKTKKLKSIGKKAFSKIKKGAAFKCPKGKKKAYKKLLKKSGLPKKAKVK